ncbi:MAG TPA: phage holin family protein [Actinomycetota bacterium]
MDREPADQSIPELVKTISTDVATLVRQEAELARVEIVDAVNARLKAAGAVAFGGLLALFVLAFVGLAASTALDNLLPAWASRLVVAGGFLVVALAAVAFARSKLKTPVAPETKKTLREDVEWAKAQTKP